MEKIKIGILGYGNLGKGVESAMKQNTDMEVIGVFSRRDPTTLKTLTGVNTYHVNELIEMKDEIDVLILCGGSATDLPVMTPEYAKYFNVVDSYDSHATIPEHLERVNTSAEAAGKVAIISVGWDPGLFSMERVLFSAAAAAGSNYTFWGKGVSQGHSDAIRRIEGVQDARQYTIPVPEALEAVRSGSNPELTTREKHLRECYVVAKQGADISTIEENIVTMPNYFADYDTTVYFITQEELDKNHAGLPHGGHVIRSGVVGLDNESKANMEFVLELDSNSLFTSSVLVAFARAAYRLNKRGDKGAKTAFDIPLVDIHPMERAQLIKEML